MHVLNMHYLKLSLSSVHNMTWVNILHEQLAARTQEPDLCVSLSVSRSLPHSLSFPYPSLNTQERT